MNKTTMKLAVLAAGMMLASGAAQATTFSYNFLTGSGTDSSSNSYGNDWTFTSNGVTATATAWGLTSLNSTFAAAQLGDATGYGLWVCNQTEGINCASPNHQIDNNNGYDFVLIHFSQPVDPSTFSITTYSNADLDVTYYLGNTAANTSLAGVNLNGLTGLGFGTAINNDNSSTVTSRIVQMNNTAAYNSVLIAARLPLAGSNADANADYFKITGMSLASPSGVPEPSTVALTGAALVMLGLVGRRRAVK